MSTESIEKINRLARDVLRLSRNTLLVNMRYLDLALSQFQWIPIMESTYMTDGYHLLYNPSHVLRSYKSEKEAAVRDYLHITMHCIFKHMFMNPTINRPIWDLATDIAVENMITEFGLRSVSSFRENEQKKYISKIKDHVKILTAEKIYRFLLDQKLSLEESADWRGAFYADDHAIWYMTNDDIESTFGVSFSENPSSGESDSEDKPSDSSSRQSIAETWTRISERIQEDLETFSKSRGDQAGSMMQNLREVNREKHDYSEFLKKFAVLGEVMKINDDEFDYIYYTYGLTLYDNMPLIEPLEYKEEKRIKEFVIAIDTSGSVQGAEVQAFIQKTYNILKSTESFFSKVNVHIIQCDSVIQEHVKITNQEEFDYYLAHMQIRGLGGTDFRPVFHQVEELIANREFTNLRGLVYFTDGNGVFPEKKPDYETAFVFVKDDYAIPQVPVWAIKLVLQKDELEQKRVD